MKLLNESPDTDQLPAEPATAAATTDPVDQLNPAAAAEPQVNDFLELDLPKELYLAIDKLGFTTSTTIQKEVLPYSLDGRDIIAQAQTGTGKTAAFLISVITYHLEHPEYDPRPAGTPFALIIAPTRELVMQIAEDAISLSLFTDKTLLKLLV